MFVWINRWGVERKRTFLWGSLWGFCTCEGRRERRRWGGTSARRRKERRRGGGFICLFGGFGASWVGWVGGVGEGGFGLREGTLHAFGGTWGDAGRPARAGDGG